MADALSRLTVSFIDNTSTINYKDLSTDQALDTEFTRLRHSKSSTMNFKLLESFDNNLMHRISTDLKKYDAVLSANTRHSSNTVSKLGQLWRRWLTLKQHWLNALCLLGGVTAKRPNARAVHTSTLLVGVQCQIQLA